LDYDETINLLLTITLISILLLITGPLSNNEKHALQNALGSSPSSSNATNTTGLPIMAPRVSTTNNTAANMSTASGSSIVMSNNSSFYLQSGQLYGDRVVEVNKGIPKIEFSYHGFGSAKGGINTRDRGTIVYTLEPNGSSNGSGQGVMISNGGALVTYALKFSGQEDKQLNALLQGSIEFDTKSKTGRLVFMNNTKAILKGNITGDGKINLQAFQ
jgi:hypothetical protein